MPDTSNRLKIFISYSRQDSIATETVVAALESAGFDVTVDTRDLPFGEAWQSELQDFIRSCDTVVWLVSPHSVASRWVNWELGEVQRAGKRLIPVQITGTPVETLPEVLGKIHMLPGVGTFQMERDLPLLVNALKTDISWIKEHTRLGIQARVWIEQSRGKDRLLRGNALKAAETWRIAQPPGTISPSPAILDLLAASAQQAKQRLRQWIGGISVTAIVLLAVAAFAIAQWIAAVANEQTANRRAARLSVPAAATLREDGFNAEALLVLLNAAEQFDDANAPTELRIELERSLIRANMERGRGWLPETSSVEKKEIGHLIAMDPSGAEIPIPPYSSALAKEYDCAQIYADPEYDFEELVPSDKFDDLWVIDRCEQKGSYVLLHRTVDRPHDHYDTFSVFALVGKYRIFTVSTPQDFQNFTWEADDMNYVFSYAEDRHITVKTSILGQNVEKTFAQRSAPEFLYAPTVDTLIAISKEGVEPDDYATSRRFVIYYDLVEKNPFTEQVKQTDQLNFPAPEYGGSATKPLLHRLTCDEKAVDADRMCQMISPDGRWRVEISGVQLELFDENSQVKPLGTLDLGEAFHLSHSKVSFYDNGPDLLLLDDTTGDSVDVWTPPQVPNGRWSRRQIYRSSEQLSSAEVDATGDRLILFGAFESEDFREGWVYSISARQVWRRFDGDTGTGAYQLNDGSIYHSSHTVHRFPELSELTELAGVTLPVDCAPATGKDWRSSSCWPQSLD